MHAPQDDTPGPDPASGPGSLKGAWRSLLVGLGVAGALLLALGTVGLLAVCLSLPSSGFRGGGEDWLWLVAVGWSACPIVAGLLLLLAVHHVARAGAEAGAWLIAAAAGVLLALAWLGVTVAVLLGGGLRG
jgi:hypothetical protein